MTPQAGLKAATVSQDPYDIAWAHSLWASDPLWTNPGDGNPVSSWRNASGGGDPAAAGAVRPTFRASVAAYNNKPAIQFVRASSQVLDVDVTDIPQTYSVVVIGNTSGSGNPAERMAAAGNSTAGGIGDTAGPGHTYVFAATTQLVGSAADANPHLFRGYANGVASVLAVDGTTQATGSGGTNALTRLTIGAASNATPAFLNFLQGHVAFVGIVAGDVSALVGWSRFKAFARFFYGLTIA